MASSLPSARANLVALLLALPHLASCGPHGHVAPAAATLVDATGQPNEAAAKTTVEVAVEYFPRCSHCVRFIASSVAPLVEAQLPGNAFKFGLLPWVDEEVMPGQCTMTSLCALNATFPSYPHPSPADAPTLKSGVKFVACALQVENSADGCTSEGLQDCAKMAGLPWDGDDGLAACASGPQSLHLASSAAGAMHLDGRGPSPFVYINDESKVGWDGSLIFLACEALDPKPAACQSEDSLETMAQEQAKTWVSQEMLTQKVGPCENCVEVGSFHWDSSAERSVAWLLPAALAASAFTGVVLFAAWRRARAGAPGAERLVDSDNEQGLAAE